MFRTVGKIITLAVLVAAGSAGLMVYNRYFSVDQQIRQLEEEKRELQQIVQRLSAERRVAEVLVTEQKRVDGVLHTTVLFVEYSRDGKTTLTPRSFTYRGEYGHIDAMVIRFERGLVEEGDALRGHSIALFTTIYGDLESPSEGARIDRPGEIPEIYRGADPRVSEFEMELWRNFWRLAEDPVYAEKMGVDIANGQGLWAPFKPDLLYTIWTEADGGVKYRVEPVKGIYREALKQRVQNGGA
jgi:hypothetical protein